MILRLFTEHLPEKFFFTSPLKYCDFCIHSNIFVSLYCISSHTLEPETNYQLFNLITGFAYKDAIATIARPHYDWRNLHISILTCCETAPEMKM